jgi:hypothetical protein
LPIYLAAELLIEAIATTRVNVAIAASADTTTTQTATIGRFAKRLYEIHSSDQQE